MFSGRKRLRDWIDRSKVNQNEAAKILSVHPVILSQWLSGIRKPALENAIKIEHVTGIAVESWLLTDLHDAETLAAEADANLNVAKR